MDWKGKLSKLNGKMTKEKWLILLLLGAFFMILSFPVPGGGKKTEPENSSGGAGEAVGLSTEKNAQETEEAGAGLGGSSASTSSFPAAYEERLEARIRELLGSVEGVGNVDVMVVLSSTSQKVLRVDRSGSSTVTKESDSSGGTREVTESQSQETTVLPQSGSQGNAPVVEKELSPEISGIIISADGGGSPAVRSEISQAMEALLGLPAHKIKVLKRVE